MAKKADDQYKPLKAKKHFFGMVLSIMGKTHDDQANDKGQAQRRLQAILNGAFAGPPTPLKDIPKKSGESRAARGKPQRRKTSAPKSA